MTEKITEKILEIINLTDMLTKSLSTFSYDINDDCVLRIKFNFTEKGDLFFCLSLINNAGKIIDKEQVYMLKRENIKEKVEVLLSRNNIN